MVVGSNPWAAQPLRHPERSFSSHTPLRSAGETAASEASGKLSVPAEAPGTLLR